MKKNDREDDVGKKIRCLWFIINYNRSFQIQQSPFKKLSNG